MNIIKIIIYGVLGGLLYGLSSFYLLTPYIRGNVEAIFPYGIQGLIYAIAYIFLKNFINKKLKNIASVNRIVSYQVLLGACSGLISGSPNIIITYYNAIVRFQGVVALELRNSIINELLYFSFGCIILGGLLGYLLHRKSS